MFSTKNKVSYLRSSLLVAIMGVLCGLAPQEAQALSASQCNSIRSQMTRLANDNRRFKCTYRGPEWRYTTAHHTWCLRASSATGLQRQIQKMRKEIDACRRCVPYAKRSVKQQLTNITRRCKQRGAQWHARYASHFQWCKRTSRSQSDRMIAQRDRVLKGCTSETKKKQCRQHGSEYQKIRGVVSGYRCHVKGSRLHWPASAKAYEALCLKQEFGASLIHKYRKLQKTCQRCLKYASKMVAISRDTTTYRCSLRAGFSSYKHIEQCMNEPQYRSNNRLINFTKRTIDCRCQKYADHAIKACKDNRKYRCGYERKSAGRYGHGSQVFSCNRANHLWWCKRQSTAKMKQAMLYREARIRACRTRRR